MGLHKSRYNFMMFSILNITLYAMYNVYYETAA